MEVIKNCLERLNNWALLHPRKTALIVGLVIIVVLIAGHLQKKLRSPDQKKHDLVRAVASHILLPEGEEPTLVTISDAGKLADEPFFVRAKNGDIVLIYKKAGKAYLYRPSINRLVDLSALAREDPVKTNKEAKKNTTSATIAIYNGAHLSKSRIDAIEKEIKDTFIRVNIVTKEDAARSDYPKTMVVDIGGLQTDKASLARDLAKFLNAEVGIFPEDEQLPPSDILIILGKN